MDFAFPHHLTVHMLASFVLFFHLIFWRQGSWVLLCSSGQPCTYYAARLALSSWQSSYLSFQNAGIIEAHRAAMPTLFFLHSYAKTVLLCFTFSALGGYLSFPRAEGSAYSYVSAYNSGVWLPLLVLFCESLVSAAPVRSQDIFRKTALS